MAEKKQSSNQMAENFFVAIDTLVNKRIENLPYDKTVIAHIEDNSQAQKGKYVVNDGTSSFEAFSENVNYQLNENVYVNIPQGDFKNQKIITGKYVPNDSNSVAYNYVSPMNRFINITGNIIDTTETEWELIANDDVQTVTVYENNNLQLKGYDTLGISAQFRSWLKEYKVLKGSYGIRIDIGGKAKVLQEDRKTYDIQTIYYSYYLDKADMTGDPYNYDTYYLQEKIYNIEDIVVINYIKVSFYQNNDFLNSLPPNEHRINVFGDSRDPNRSYSNLFLQEPVIAFGYNLENFTQDKILLYSFNADTYTDKITPQIKEQYPEKNFNDETEVFNFLNNTLNKKTIHLRWIHLITEEDNSQFIGTNGIYDKKAVSIESLQDIEEYYPSDDSDVLEPVIKWYHYEVTDNVADYDAAAGTFWVEMPECRNSFNIEVIPDITLTEEKWKAIIELPSAESIEIAIEDQLNVYGGLNSQRDAVIENFETNYPNSFLADIITNNSDKWITCINNIQTIMNDTVLTQEEKNYQANLEINKLKDLLASINNEAPHFYNDYNIQTAINNLTLDNYNIFVQELQQGFDNAIEYYKTALGETNSETQFLIKVQELRESLKSLDSQIESLKATLRGNITYYHSDEIAFLNENKDAGLNQIQLLRDLTIECDAAGLLGKYHIYDQTGYIKNEADAKRERVLTAKYVSYDIGEQNLDNAERIQWRIPLINTMIQPPEEGVEYLLYEPTFLEVTADNYKSGTFYVFDKTTNNYRLLNSESEDEFNNYIKYYVRNDTTYEEIDGYAVITRFGTKQKPEGLIVKTETEIKNSSDQYFRIKPVYSNNLTNNTIYCSVYKSDNNIKLEAETTLEFATAGNSGTDYTFYLEFKDKTIALTAGGFTQEEIDRGEHKITVIPKVFNYNGRDITSEISNFNWRWYSQGDGGIESEENEDGTAMILYSSVADQVDPAMHLFYDNILACQCTVDVTVENENILNSMFTTSASDGKRVLATTTTTVPTKSVTLTAYLAIPVRKYQPHNSSSTGKEVYGFDGNSLISYDNMGTSPYYYKNNFKIYNYNNENRLVPNEAIQWTIQRRHLEMIEENGETRIITVYDESPSNFSPHITSNGALIVPSMYLNNFDATSVLAKYNDEVIFILPLYIYKRVYDSKLLNSWDGSLTLNKNDGIILSTMMGAGYKTLDNKFTGVLMGDVSIADGQETSIPAFEPYYSGTGLYGYNEGEKSFGLNVNGRAFFGKAGRGQLLFDGENGSITSAAWYTDKIFQIENLGIFKVEETQEGTYMDIDDGWLELHGSTKLFFKDSDIISPLILNESDKIIYPNILSNENEEITVSESDNLLTEEDLTTNNLELGQTSIILNSDPEIDKTNLTSDPYFLISTDRNKELIYIGEYDYYLQSADFYKENPFISYTTDDQILKLINNGLSILHFPAGTHINLTNGRIESYNFKLHTEGTPPLGYGIDIGNNDDGTFSFNVSVMDSNHVASNYYKQIDNIIKNSSLTNTQKISDIRDLIWDLYEQSRGINVIQIESPSWDIMDFYKNISDTGETYLSMTPPDPNEYSERYINSWYDNYRGIIRFISPNYADSGLGYITYVDGLFVPSINNPEILVGSEETYSLPRMRGTKIDLIQGKIKTAGLSAQDCELQDVSIQHTTINAATIQRSSLHEVEAETIYIKGAHIKNCYLANMTAVQANIQGTIINKNEEYWGVPLFTWGYTPSRTSVEGTTEGGEPYKIYTGESKTIHVTYSTTLQQGLIMLNFSTPNQQDLLDYSEYAELGLFMPSGYGSEKTGFGFNLYPSSVNNKLVYSPYIFSDETLRIKFFSSEQWERTVYIAGRRIILKDVSEAAAYVKVINENHEISLSTNQRGGVFCGTKGDWIICINKAETSVTMPINSDRRLKHNIEDLSNYEALSILQNVDIVNFSYKKDLDNTIHNGIIAQQLRDTLIKYNISYRPYLMIQDLKDPEKEIQDLNTDEDTVKYSIDYSKFTPLLWKGWQIHNNQIKELNNIISKLEQEILELKEFINENY